MTEWVINASADSWFTNQYPNGNYSIYNSLRVARGANTYFYIEKRACIKFNIVNIPDYTEGCFLRLAYVRASIPSGLNPPTITVSWVNNNWTEETLTANTEPTLLMPARQFAAHDTTLLDEYFDIDVSDYVRYCLNGERSGTISFKISMYTDLGSDAYYVDFYSRETDFPPRLVFKGASEGTHEDLVREAGMSVTPPAERVFTYSGGYAPMPIVPPTYIVREAVADTYIDRGVYQPPFYEAGDEHELKISAGIGVNDFATALKFDLTGIPEVRTATLQMQLTDYSGLGNYIVLQLTQYDASMMSDTERSNTNCYKDANAIKVFSYIAYDLNGLGTFAIDVTGFVKSAIAKGHAGVAFVIGSYELPTVEGDVIYMTFASREAPTAFKPHLLINPIIPGPTSKTIEPDADCELTTGTPNPTTVRVCAAEHRSHWMHFNLINLYRTVKSAKLHFCITWESNFADCFMVSGLYEFNIKGHSLNLNVSSTSASTSGHDSWASSKAYQIDPEPWYYGTDDSGAYDIYQEVDVTDILNSSMWKDGLVLEIGYDTNSAHGSTFAHPVIGGRTSAYPPYLELVLDPPYIAPLAELDTTDGKAVILTRHDTSGFYYDGVYYDSPSVPKMYNSGLFEFDLTQIPDDAFPKLDMAVLCIPLLGLVPTTSNAYDIVVEYKLSDINHSAYVWRDAWVHISPGQYYLEIDLADWLRVYANYDRVKYGGGGILTVDFHLEINLSSGDLVTDTVKFGTIEAGYPAYIKLRWDDYGLSYYVNADSGDDNNLGIYPDIAWRTWEHAVTHVPAGKTLYHTGNFVWEPPDNIISPTHEPVTVKHLSVGGNSFVEINPGYSRLVYPFQAVNTYDYLNSGQPDRYRIEYNYHWYSTGSVVTTYYLYLYFDTHDIVAPVLSAILRFYIIYEYESVSASPVEYHDVIVFACGGGTTPETMTQLIGSAAVIYNIGHNQGYWLDIDVTDVVNEALTNPYDDQLIMTDDIVGLRITFSRHSLSYENFVITTPLITDVNKPRLIITTDTDDFKRTPGR